MAIHCPTEPTDKDGNPHTIIGCGSSNVDGPDEEGLYDCFDCGIHFDPRLEPELKEELEKED